MTLVTISLLFCKVMKLKKDCWIAFIFLIVIFSSCSAVTVTVGDNGPVPEGSAAVLTCDYERTLTSSNDIPLFIWQEIIDTSSVDISVYQGGSGGIETPYSDSGRYTVANDSILTITNISRSDNARRFQCDVSITDDNPRTADATLTLSVAYIDTPVLKIISSPVNESESVMFVCSVNANPDPVIILYKDETVITNKTTTNLTHTIDNVTRSDAGNYTCKASNIAGSRTSQIEPLVVYFFDVDTIMFKINSSPAIEGESVMFVCSVNANPDPVIILYKDGTEITSKTTTNLTYTIPHVMRSDAGNYTCKASNMAGSGTSPNETLVVIDIDPCISNPCENGGTCITGSMDNGYTCICKARYTGTNCETDIWLYIGVGIGAFAIGLLLIAAGILLFIKGDGSTFTKFVAYILIVIGCILTVLGICVLFYVIEKMKQTSNSVTVKGTVTEVGRDAVMKVTITLAAGECFSQLTWYKRDVDGVLGEAIVADGKGRYSLSSDDRHLMISKVEEGDAGYYLCKVTTSTGNTAEDYSKLGVFGKKKGKTNSRKKRPTDPVPHDNVKMDELEGKSNLVRNPAPGGDLYTQVNMEQKKKKPDSDNGSSKPAPVNSDMKRYPAPDGQMYAEVNKEQKKKTPDSDNGSSKPAPVDLNAEGLQYADLDLTRNCPAGKQDVVNHPDSETMYSSITHLI